MAYKDRHGYTKIIDKDFNNLFIVNDEGPLLTYTPHMSDTFTHYHIELDKDQAKVLRDWLDEYLKD